jgi:hypothetical protein
MPSLPPAFTSFADTISKKVSAFMMAKRAKLRVISKLETREITPSSIRFKFELTGSNEVTGNDDFFGLAAACSMSIQACQQDLKSYMKQAAQLEIAAINQKHRAVFYQALNGFAQLILIEKAPGPVTPTALQVRQLALTTLDRNVEHFTKAHNFHLDANTLFSEYKTTTNDALPLWTLGTAGAVYYTDHANDITRLTSIMFETVVQRWLEKARTMNEKEKASLLEATQRSFFKEVSTKEAAEALALEKSIDESKMDSVISSKIATEHKALRAQISKLETMIQRTNISETQKNSQGGANPTRASKEKPNSRKQAPTPGNATKQRTAKKKSNGQNPEEAAAAASATTRRRAAAKGKKKKTKNAGNASKKKVTFGS